MSDEGIVYKHKPVPLKLIGFCVFIIALLFFDSFVLRDFQIESAIKAHGWNVRRVSIFSPKVLSKNYTEITFCSDFINLYLEQSKDGVKLYHTVQYGYGFITGDGMFYYFLGHNRGSW